MIMLPTHDWTSGGRGRRKEAVEIQSFSISLITSYVEGTHPRKQCPTFYIPYVNYYYVCSFVSIKYDQSSFSQWQHISVCCSHFYMDRDVQSFQFPGLNSASFLAVPWLGEGLGARFLWSVWCSECVFLVRIASWLEHGLEDWPLLGLRKSSLILTAAEWLPMLN